MGQSERDFEEAFRHMLPMVFRLAYRILGNVAAAEDVSSEALARAFARWNEIKALPYREAWVMRVAANIALNIARRKTPIPDHDRLVDVEEAAALRTTLAHALRALPRRQREALVLRYLAGYSESEVAATLEVAPGTVKTHIHRGLNALRRQLGDVTFEEGSLVLD